MSEIKAIENLRKLSKEVVDMRWGVEFDRAVDALEAEIAERYMQLPVDADGVPIRVGDYLQLSETRGHVVALTYCPYNELPWEWQCDSNSDWYNTKFTRHAEPRTVEDVLADFARDLASDRTDSYEHRIERLGTKYADELREMLGGDAE